MIICIKNKVIIYLLVDFPVLSLFNCEIISVHLSPTQDVKPTRWNNKTVLFYQPFILTRQQTGISCLKVLKNVMTKTVKLFTNIQSGLMIRLQLLDWTNIDSILRRSFRTPTNFGISSRHKGITRNKIVTAVWVKGEISVLNLISILLFVVRITEF